MNNYQNVPTVIYDCKIVAFGWPRDRGPKLPWGIAICAGKRGGYWLTLCEDDRKAGAWRPIERRFHEKFDEAKDEAERKYGVTAWRPI